MVGILIVSHNTLSKAFKDTLEMIIGEKDYVDYAGFYEGETPESFRNKMLKKIEDLKQRGYDDIIIFADLFGGTPCNQAITLLKHLHLIIITGVNLPMLLQICLLNNNDDISNIVKVALENGVKGIFNATEFVKKIEKEE